LKTKPAGQQMTYGVSAFLHKLVHNGFSFSIHRAIHPDTTPTLKLRKQHEILNNPEYMPLVSLAVN
jgi:hypothetical protein